MKALEELRLINIVVCDCSGHNFVNESSSFPTIAECYFQVFELSCLLSVELLSAT